jgi:hypothetical protein
MPTSPNRRRIEIPVVLFARLEERARRDGQTLAGLVATLLSNALDAPARTAAGTPGDEAANSDLRSLLQQVLHNDALQLRELQFAQQRLDLLLHALIEGQPHAQADPTAPSAAGRPARERLLDALTETYVAAPLRPATTLSQTGEPRPALSRTLWQRPAEAPERAIPGKKPEE